jgi:hypothetical protein
MSMGSIEDINHHKTTLQEYRQSTQKQNDDFQKASLSNDDILVGNTARDVSWLFSATGCRPPLIQA